MTVAASLGAVARAALDGGAAALAGLSIAMHRPVLPMQLAVMDALPAIRRGRC